MSWLDAAASGEVERMKSAGTWYPPRIVDAGRLPRTVIEGRERVVFCSNDYLGLAGHPRVAEGAKRAIERFGAGQGSGRSLAGTTRLHVELEERLAALVGKPAALLFPSAYTANVGLLMTVLGPSDRVLSDRLNHASIIDGCRASGADVRIVGHVDLEALERALAEPPPPSERIAIVVDGVFSMEGVLAPLQPMAERALRSGAALIVDDAHGLGVYGPKGAGTAAHLGCTDRTDAIVGTLGKALSGTMGGFVAGSATLVELLRLRARNFVFTNPVPASTAGAVLAALDVLEQEPERQHRLHALAGRLRDALQASGLRVGGTAGPIVPLMVGETRPAFELARRLFDAGFHVQAFGHPIVPHGTARLRLMVSAAHTDDDVDRLAETIVHEAIPAGVSGESLP